MALYRGSGGAGDATTDAYASQIANYAQTATTKANEAQVSATAANQSANEAQNSATASDLSAVDSAFAASQAANSASEASASAASAEAAKTQVEDYLNNLTSNIYQQATEPTGDSVTLGDLWFNTGTSDLYVYREISSNTFEWVAILINNISDDSDILDAGAF